MGTPEKEMKTLNKATWKRREHSNVVDVVRWKGPTKSQETKNDSRKKQPERQGMTTKGSYKESKKEQSDK